MHTMIRDSMRRCGAMPVRRVRRRACGLRAEALEPRVLLTLAHAEAFARYQNLTDNPPPVSDPSQAEVRAFAFSDLDPSFASAEGHAIADAPGVLRSKSDVRAAVDLLPPEANPVDRRVVASSLGRQTTEWVITGVPAGTLVPIDLTIDVAGFLETQNFSGGGLTIDWGTAGVDALLQVTQSGTTSDLFDATAELADTVLTAAGPWQFTFVPRFPGAPPGLGQHVVDFNQTFSQHFVVEAGTSFTMTAELATDAFVAQPLELVATADFFSGDGFSFAMSPSTGLLAPYVPTADLAIAVSDAPDPVEQFQTVEYSVVVTNNGPDDAEGVFVTPGLHPDFVITTATLSQGQVSGGQWNIGNIPAGTQVTATFGTFTGFADTAPIPAEFSVSSGTQDPSPVDNHAFGETTVLPVLDFGDAPASYGTLLADDGARHWANGPQLGRLRDANDNGVPHPNAAGDDLDADDDEDGIFNPESHEVGLSLLEGSQPRVLVDVTNLDGEELFVYGWIDYNGDGVFDNATERAEAVLNGAEEDTLVTLLFPTAPEGSAGDTFARFRVSTDQAAQNPTGEVRDGEVEDYKVRINAPLEMPQPLRITEGSGGFTGSLNPRGRFGMSVAALGDLDGDGVIDIAATTSHSSLSTDNLGDAAVWILFLNADGTVKTHQKISGGPGGLAGGLDDFFTFGSSVAALGDLDGDGLTDIAVGAPGAPPSQGIDGPPRGGVWILFLNADGTVKTHQKIDAVEGNFTGPLHGVSSFGDSLAALGDLDGDGVTDLAVGDTALERHPIGENTTLRGGVWILFLNTDGTVKAHQQISGSAGGFSGVIDSSDQFGASVANLGDVDGDGVIDLAVGERRDDDGAPPDDEFPFNGAVWILFLNQNGTVKSHQKISESHGGFVGELDDGLSHNVEIVIDGINVESGNGDQFGASVAGIGDINGDGIPDVAVGARTDDDGGISAGALWLLMLNADGTVKEQQKISATSGGFLGDLGPLEQFGTSVAPLGDFDGNGSTDFVVGAWEVATGPGAVWIYFRGDGQGGGGGAQDTDGVADSTENAAPGNGDGNGDGVSDSAQNRVASLPSTTDSYVTLVSPAGTMLIDVAAIANPSPADAPAAAQFPLGFFEFSVQGVGPGSATTVELILHDEPVINGYYKYGRSPADPLPHWYPFLFDGTTGAELVNDDADPGIERIILHFVDGQRGDDDLTSNGVIVDPGAPAFVESVVAAPKIDSVVINDGHAQRSKINSITVTFDSAVTIAAGAFELVHESGVHIALAIALSEVAGSTAAVLTFNSPWIIGGSLFDGDYTLLVRGDKIIGQNGATLDGDNDGQAGGNHQEEFFRRFGDSDGDGDVDRRDRNAFLSTFPSRARDPDYLWYFDFNDDGRVALIDLLAFTVASIFSHH